MNDDQFQKLLKALERIRGGLDMIGVFLALIFIGGCVKSFAS